MTSANSRGPIVLERARLLTLLLWLSKQHKNKLTVVICESRADFDAHLFLELHTTGSDMLQPTLEMLSITRSIDLRYCSSVQALHAYLTAHSVQESSSRNETTEDTILTIVDPIRLHEPSPSYSAQGLSRFFAAAVDASLFSRSQLYVVECETQLVVIENMPTSLDDDMAVSVETETPSVDQEEPSLPPVNDPWRSEVPILNATTRSFGPGERGWMGRTVEIRRIAARWCRFKQLDEL